MVEQGSNSAQRHLRPGEQLMDELGMGRVDPPANPGPLPIVRTRREFLGISGLGIGGGVVFAVADKSRREHKRILSQQAAAAYPLTRLPNEVQMANDLFTSLVNHAQRGDVETIQTAAAGQSLDAAALIVAEDVDRKNKIATFISDRQGFRFWRDTIALASGATVALVSGLSLAASAYYHIGRHYQRSKETGSEPQNSPQV